jgi:hypothetical protein
MANERHHFEPGKTPVPAGGASIAWLGRSRERVNIVEYLADFGFTLGDLRTDQLSMFVAARNAAPYVEELEIPIATQPDETAGTTLAERETQRTLQLTTYASDDLESRLPTDEMDVSLAQNAEDLPRIFPTQWLLEETQPALFYKKLADRELLMPVWQRQAANPEDSQGDALERELVEDGAAADSAKQHAYVLLDTSRTMNDHDRRGTVARGLTLAFLRNGHQQRARLNLRPFTAAVGELSSGVGYDELHAIARRIVDLPNAGQTRIQTALEQAVADIRSTGLCWRADIVLITDGISRLLENPLGEEKLHTFILGDLFEKEGEANTVATLKEWSTTFQRVWKNRFADILAPTLDDVRAASAVLDATLSQENRGSAEPESLRRLLANVKMLLDQYKASQDTSVPLPPEIAGLREQLEEDERALSAASETTPVEPPPGVEASGRVSLELWGPDGARGTPTMQPGLWLWLRRLGERAWTWTVEQCRRIFRRTQ